MNFKSKILKLSILIMLVLVLLPVIAAQDSSEAFFVEYSDESDEVIFEESYFIDEIEDSQEYVSLCYEIGEANNEEEYTENIHIYNQSSEIDDTIIIKEEQIEFSVVETQDVIDEINEKEEITIYCENVIDNIIGNNDIDEDVDRDMTIENICIKHGSNIFISEEFNDDIILINELYTESANYNTPSFKRSLIKVLELKNNLLINQEVSFVFADKFMADIDEDIIIRTDKVTTDFVFSIDNSVIGDDYLIIFAAASFCLDFTPCFNDFYCNFFDFESFFDGDNNIYYYNSFIINSYFNVNILYISFSAKSLFKNFLKYEVKT